MAIHVRRRHTLDPEEARRRVEEVARELAEDLHIHYEWKGDRLEFHRLGVQGYIELRDGEIEVFMKKSFLLPVSESWLRDHVEEYLNRHLA